MRERFMVIMMIEMTGYIYDENANLMIVIGDKLKYYADQLSLSIRNILMNQQG